MNKCPRPEYPRPDFQREHWLNLNGMWNFAFDDDNRGKKEQWYVNEALQTTIVVPFVYQCKASTVHDSTYHPIQWYTRTVAYTPTQSGMRLFLCFGAVDYQAEVWVNGMFLGSHRGGYTPFSFDITEALGNTGDALVAVRCEDRKDCSQPRGKQYWKEQNDRCWYTPSSGIWQTVWIEERPESCIQAFSLVPSIDSSSLTVQVTLNAQPLDPGTCSFTLSKDGKQVKNVVFSMAERSMKWVIPIAEVDYIDELHYWSPENPFLYDVVISWTYGQSVDTIHSYVGIRKIEIADGRVLLNNKPLYQRLVLDQAYWEDSLLTAPTDDAYKQDIACIKAMGFNGVRLHQKIEDPRFYYWADTLGLLVWAEMPSAYCFNPVAVWNTIEELHAFIERDMNHPSIVCWVLLNESWGVRNIYAQKDQQQYALTLYQMAKMLDPSRLVDTNDGWEQVTSDICGVHDYVRDGKRFAENWNDVSSVLQGAAQKRMVYASGFAYAHQPILVTEFGGIAFSSDTQGDNWGYADSVQTDEQFLHRFESLIKAIRQVKEIQGFCYTQFTDVMQEVNGLLDIKRDPKVDVDAIKRIVEL